MRATAQASSLHDVFQARGGGTRRIPGPAASGMASPSWALAPALHDKGCDAQSHKPGQPHPGDPAQRQGS